MFTQFMGAFHSMKNSGLGFRKFLATNGTAFSGISGKEDNLARYNNGIPKFSEISFREFLSHLIFIPEFPEFSVEWFAFSGNLSWKFSYYLSPFLNFRNFWLNRKRPILSLVSVLKNKFSNSLIIQG